MTAIQKRVIIMGIKIKLARDEKLEDILLTYINLTDAEKQEIRNDFNTQEG